MTGSSEVMNKTLQIDLLKMKIYWAVKVITVTLPEADCLDNSDNS